jgi:Domain of unknown function (DUF4232)
MTLVTHRLRSTLSALVLPPLVVVLAACAPHGFAGTGSVRPTGVGSSSVPPTPSPTSPTASAAVSGSASAGQSPSRQTGGGTRCSAGQLHISVAAGPNAAGHVGLLLVFTNISAQACTMYGYPGVSFVTGPSGTQVNDPAQRSAAQGPPAVVPLAPNGKAHASLLLVNVANYPANSCKPTQVAGMRVYPPDDTTALFVSSPQQICMVKGTGVAQIYPIQTGATAS